MDVRAAGRENGPSANPNIVPLIDVLLVLIIIFMVISPSNTGLPAQVPQPAPSAHLHPA